MQYFVGIGVFFFIGGLNAMLIRTELCSPTRRLFPPGQYLTLVGLHGTMMIMMMSAVILGPFGNYFVPLMIGAKRHGVPAHRGAHVLAAAAGRRRSSCRPICVGGIPTGWTGYPPLADQAQRGHGRVHRRVRADRASR